MDPFLDFVVLLTHNALLSKNMYIVSETINLSLLLLHFGRLDQTVPGCLLVVDSLVISNWKIFDVLCSVMHSTLEDAFSKALLQARHLPLTDMH